MAQNDQRFEQLKKKYQSVQKAMAQHQVRLENLNMQGDKLFMRAEAASEEAKNKVRDQIKMVDPSYSVSPPIPGSARWGRPTARRPPAPASAEVRVRERIPCGLAIHSQRSANSSMGVRIDT
jgi:hypothetical protein